MFEVIRGLEKPKVTRKPVRRRKYPFETMEIGEAFFVPGKKAESMRSYAGSVGRALGRKYSVRTVTMRKTNLGWRSCSADTPGAIAGAAVWREK